MPYRPDPSEFERPLTQEDLKHIWNKLAMLSPYLVREEYRRVYKECCLDGERIPNAGTIQELVTIWKFLRHGRRRDKRQ